MSIMCWNCQELGSSEDLTIRRLREMRKEYFPEILFIMETKHKRNILVDLQEWLGYERVFTVNPVGYSGGLAVFLKSNVDIEVKYADKNLIDLHVQFGEVRFFVSCVYGDPVMEMRPKVWERITRIGIHRKDPWCMLGYFNDILHNGEEKGGPMKCDSTFLPFSDMLKAAEMVELTSSGNHFTWGGMRYKKWIQCRLDRCFGNNAWCNLFPVANQTFLAKRGSDHRPVLVRLLASNEMYRGQFRFDKRFLNKPRVKETIDMAWKFSQSRQMASVSERLRNCRKALSKWKKANMLNSLENINKLQKELEVEQSADFPSTQKVNLIRNQLVVAHREEEAYWSQKSNDRWLDEGDRNTKFFHASVKVTRKKKRLEKLQDVNGNYQKGEASKGEVSTSYFSELFKSSNPSSFQDIFSGFAPKVSDRMNESLIKEVTMDEVYEAVFAIKPFSAPGPDGMLGLFFQKYWRLLANKSQKKFRNSSRLESFLLNGTTLIFVYYQR